uniref:Uncharacterized protein n=1 Tax=Biomphalaria glabrata TaxID=6526 RepID=A0A2C9JVT4_BIOGL
PGDPEYYQFLDSEMAVREISGNSKRLYDYRYFSKVARFSVDEEMSLIGREYHMVEQVYYNTFPKHLPMIWKTYDPESFQVLKKDFARGTSVSDTQHWSVALAHKGLNSFFQPQRSVSNSHNVRRPVNEECSYNFTWRLILLFSRFTHDATLH